MHLDHLTFAAGPAGLAATTHELSKALGVESFNGGIHPRFGTKNRLFPLKNQQYLEVVEVLDHPASDKAAFGQAVRARTELGGGWLHWCIAVDDIGPVEERIGRHAVPGNRRRPDGVNMEWVQIGLHDVRDDPALPYVTQWITDPAEHPSQAGSAEVELTVLEIAGHPQRLADWLGEKAVTALETIEVRWVAPNAMPGIVAAEFNSPNGTVRI